MLQTLDRHPLRPVEFWQARLQHLYTVLQVMDDQQVQDLNRRVEIEMELGLVHTYLTQAGDENLQLACEYAAALAELRVCQRRSPDFAVEIKQPEKTIHIEANQSVNFGWPDWLSAFSLALILDNKDAQNILSTAECVDACSLPFDNVDRFWPFLCAAFAAVFQQDPLAEQLIEDAENYLQDVSIMQPAYVEHCFQPLLPVMRALLVKDQKTFTQSTTEAIESFKSYSQQQPDGDADPLALYHLPLSALMHLGKLKTLDVKMEPEYVLNISSVCSGKNIIVAKYPTLSIYDAMEAEWFMQDEGFSSHSKSILIQRDNKLLACYQSNHSVGIPHADLTFELLETDQNPFSSEHYQPALDIGQLLIRAEILTSHPQVTQSGEEVYQIEAAVLAIDLALKYLQAMGGKLKPVTLHSTTGLSLYQSEPGRFNPERLIVYRNALASQAGLPLTENKIPLKIPEQNTQQQVYALIDELKPLLLPLLQALATDETNEVFSSLQPQPGDYRKVFSVELAEKAEQQYRDWAEQQRMPIHYDENTRIDAYMAPAGMLTEQNELSRHFPGGYQSIADQLNPHRIWVSWKYYQQGDSTGYSLNGLVWLDDHWVWFPKPYRLVK